MSLIVDGLQLQDRAAGVYFDLTHGRNELPRIRLAESVIPFRAGARVETSLADRRTLHLESRVLAVPLVHQEFLDNLKARLDPTRPDAVMVRDLLPGTGLERWCWAHPRAFDIERIGGANNTPMYRASASLESLDPFWYSAYGTLDLDAGADMDDDEIMDAGAEIVVTSPTTLVTFNNPGTAEVQRVRVRFIGPSSGGVGIENRSTPLPVGFNSSTVLAADERVTVNNYLRTALRDVGAAQGSIRSTMGLRGGNRHGEYLCLVPGDNTLQILGAPAECRIAFFPTWL